MTDLAAIRERVEALTIDPRFSAHYLYGFEKCRAAVLALLADTPSVEPPEEGTVDADGTYHPTAEDHAMGNTAAGHEHWDDR